MGLERFRVATGQQKRLNHVSKPVSLGLSVTGFLIKQISNKEKRNPISDKAKSD